MKMNKVAKSRGSISAAYVLKDSIFAILNDVIDVSKEL